MYIIIRDEYKEFEKLIQEDLQVVDDRFEEEEVTPDLYPFCFSIRKFVNCIDSKLRYILLRDALQIDAAEMIEEAETLEQK